MSETIGEWIAQFVPTELIFDQSLLGERDRRVPLRSVGAALNRVADPRVDIEPLFPIEETMESW